MVQVIALTGTLPNTGKYGITAVLCGNVTDKLLDQHCLAYAGAAEQTDLSALLVGAEKIYHLDTCLQDLRLRGLLLKSRRFPVNRKILFHLWLLFIINRLTQNIEDTSQSILAHRNRDRRACSHGIHAADKAVRASHGNTSHRIITQML